jgi:hypothetical protein
MNNGLKDVEGYGVIGGHDQSDLEPEKAELNAQNEWAKAIKKYLANGEKVLEGGLRAIPNVQKNKGPLLTSAKQRAALRRS